MHDVFLFIAGMLMPSVLSIVITYVEWLQKKIKEKKC